MNNSIYPAIIPRDFYFLKNEINKIYNISKNLHIDVLDGKFTKKSSWPYTRFDNFFENIVNGQEGLPHWQDLDYDIHLMISEPLNHIEEWKNSGAKRVFIHIEALDLEDQKQIETLSEYLSNNNDFFELALAIKIETDISIFSTLKMKLSNIFDDGLKSILVMTIDKIGEQGQELSQKAIGHLENISKIFVNKNIICDGGITEENILTLKSFGAKGYVIGSAIFESENPHQEYRLFEKLLNN